MTSTGCVHLGFGYLFLNGVVNSFKLFFRNIWDAIQITKDSKFTLVNYQNIKLMSWPLMLRRVRSKGFCCIRSFSIRILPNLIALDMTRIRGRYLRRQVAGRSWTHSWAREIALVFTMLTLARSGPFTLLLNSSPLVWLWVLERNFILFLLYLPISGKREVTRCMIERVASDAALGLPVVILGLVENNTFGFNWDVAGEITMDIDLNRNPSKLESLPCGLVIHTNWLTI